MKKNILKATLVVAFALIAGMNVYNAQQSDVMSDLALANVEALASGESSTTNKIPNYGVLCTIKHELYVYFKTNCRKLSKAVQIK